MYGLLADLVALLHAAFVLFVVAGLLFTLAGWGRGWAWTRNMLFRWLHLAAIGFVVLEVWVGVSCPLTLLENSLRRAAGEGGYAVSFIGYWLDRLLFYSAPGWVFAAVYTLFALLVAVTFIAYPPRRGRGSDPR